MDSEQKQKKQSEDKSSDDEKLQHIIEAFLSDRDVAPWFRGTSIFHLRGSNDLFNAIRDDMEQKTTHRVRHCLTLIGLDPMLTSKEIALLMRVSKGSDLAFLWFLLEMHYKIPDSADVGLNEQLICSAIAHLDMITTVRELDKILPGYQPPQQKSKKVHVPETERQTYSPKYVLPYFEKQRRPKVYGLPLTIDLPNFEVDFYHYVYYKDKNYKVANENNRWFADYDFHPGRRVAYDVMRHAISEIFENLEAAKLKAKTIDVLCNHHRALKKVEDKFKQEMKVKIRDKCLKKHFGLKQDKREYRHRRTIESLNSAVEQQLSEFRKKTAKARRDFTLKTLTSDCNVTDVIVGSEYDDCCRKLSSLKDEDKLGVPIDLLSGAGEGDASAATPANKNVKYNTGTGDSVDNPPPDVGEVKNLKETQFNPTKNRSKKGCRSPSQLSVFASMYMQNYDYGHRGDTPSPSQTFFHINSEHQPHKFDYKKIFLFKEGGKNDTHNCVKEAFLDALDKDISTLTELEVAQTNLNSVASECATNTWRTELAGYKPVAESLPAKVHVDPEDKNLMDQMLSKAFEQLRKNPKFVLAQLPDAHKLPFLREWIYRRYCKVYTPKQRYLSYRQSFQVFQALDRVPFNVPTPTANDLGTNMFVQYSCRNYVATKIKDIGSKFYQHLDTAVMEQSRNYWFAMRGHLISSGPPLQTFFGYMPSRIRDIQHFRLWKKNEHRPDKAAWDKRMLLQRRLRNRM